MTGADFARAKLVPELLVSNLERSLVFWCDLVGFGVAYDRPEEKFAYLDLDGAQVMLEEVDPSERQWISGSLETPFGRGINFQIEAPSSDAVYARLTKAGLTAYMDIEEKWYRAGTSEVGVRQFLVQDPDGYLLRISSSLGQREISGSKIQ